MTVTAAKPSPKRISLPHLAMLVPWVAVVIGSVGPVRDNSYLWHIAAGEIQAETGRVLTSDPFSFTMSGEPWLTQSWLVELLYGFAQDISGPGFTGVMIMVVAALTFTGVGLLAYRWSSSLTATAVVLFLSTVLLVPAIHPRPAVFSYPLMVLVILAWDSKTLRWTLPFLMWLWASVHGSFAIGLVYMALRIISSREWKAMPQVIVAGLATLMTAHGLGVLTILADFAVARPHLALISEWRTPDFLTPALAPYLVGMVLVIYGSMKGRLTTATLWVIVPFLALGMSATRAVPSAWIALIPMVAMALGGLSWKWGRGFPLPMAIVVTAVVVLFPFLFASPVVIDEERFPVEAALHLDDVRTFHDDSAGGYLIYTDHFSEGVFIDDRVELYLDRIDDYVAIRSGRQPWEPVFEQDRIEQALLKTGEPMVGWLTAAGWQEIHRDHFYVVLRP